MIRKKGYGTKVATKGISGMAKNWHSFSQEMKALGIHVQNFELHISWQTPDNEVSSFFSLKEEQKVLTLERLRGKTNFPFVYFISYFNPALGISGDENFTNPLYEILEKKYKVKATYSYEEISAIKSSPFLCQKLNISQDDPVLFRRRLVYDDNKRPIEFNLGYYRGDSFVFSVESEHR